MGFRIACQCVSTNLCFEVFGTLSDHLETLAKYVRGKAVSHKNVLIDIRGVTQRPGAGKLFIHVLKYPSTCSCTIALVDFQENRMFCQLFERLLQTRGYQVCCFSDETTARDWLLRDHARSTTKEHCYSARQVLAAVKERLQPIRFSRLTTSSH